MALYPCVALALAELSLALSFIVIIISSTVLDGVIDGTAPLGSKSLVKRPSCRTP